ncbi:MAG: Lrp/AsnC family transcriptional regulator [Anaerolineales bacterium]|nr:MAG: Lrp/AsnC family transcriptional regulator [Anaerolineales bacterium]
MPPRKSHLDELDYQIIRHLHANARISATEIARRTGSNERTIRKRIDHLVEDGVFRLTAIIEPQYFGYINTADIFLEADPNHEKEILEGLLLLPEITYIAFGQGSKDISIEARFKDNDELFTFLHHTLPELPGVKVTGYALVPRILRNIDEWFPPRDDFGITE